MKVRAELLMDPTRAALVLTGLVRRESQEKVEADAEASLKAEQEREQARKQERQRQRQLRKAASKAAKEAQELAARQEAQRVADEVVQTVKTRLRGVVSSRTLDELLEKKDFDGLSSLLMRRKMAESKALDGPELEAVLGTKRMAHWSNRWPKFNLHRCTGTDEGERCDELLLAAGCCGRHGGNVSMRLSQGRYFEVKVAGAWKPYHRLVLPLARGLQVHHKDGNRWNNRPENLEALTVEEHFAKHREERVPKGGSS